VGQPNTAYLAIVVGNAAQRTSRPLDSCRHQALSRQVVVDESDFFATARRAYDHGYNLVPVVDAMTDNSADAHRHSVETVFPRISEIATVSDVLALLNQRASLSQPQARKETTDVKTKA